MKTYSKAVTPGFLTQYSLPLVGLNEGQVEAIERDVGGLIGVDWVSVCTQKSTLIVRYDASLISIDEVIFTLSDYGLSLGDSWWGRLKLSWQRQIDSNIADSAKHEAHCCNQVPRR
ncbi:hypothetical protein [uncultured Gilvimarinus sp.]|uniref:hypothetical protein n=1 Tax=uncultured Gilvimarinus sp. TaxID=1689143 RepID=UPI0030D70C2E